MERLAVLVRALGGQVETSPERSEEEEPSARTIAQLGGEEQFVTGTPADTREWLGRVRPN